MAAEQSSKRESESLRSGDSTFSTVLQYVALTIFDAFMLILVYTFAREANWGLATVLGIAALMTNLIMFIPALSPLRWMLPGLVFVTILVIYPIFYTVFTSFTNYGDGHLLTKTQSILLIQERKYVSPDARVYDWALYQADDGELAVWLSREGDEGLEVAFARVDQPILAVDVDDATPPETYESFTLLSRIELVQVLGEAQSLVFGEGDDTAAIRNTNEAARPLGQRFVYDAEEDTFTDQETGTVYFANDVEGFFEPRGSGDLLAPGYRVGVGPDNFSRIFTDNTDDDVLADPDLNFFQKATRAFQGPLIEIFIWTVMFAFFSVFSTFVLGLFVAIILNGMEFPGKRVARSILILPYAIPGVISILVWQGMLNQEIGIISRAITDAFGYTIPWFSDASWARMSIILVNLWLGYPYMMLISSGALQAIPSDIYEAASVDGANPVQKFRRITLPLLLVTMGPLLIASFVFNFNNFLLIDALTGGNPPIPNSPTVGGYTDILISYTYRLAFGSSRGADYGYASAITIVIFAIVALVTMFQYRLTQKWEEVGGNV